MLTLRLAPLPNTICGPNDKDYQGCVPARMRFLHPEAADSVLTLLSNVGNKFVFTDVLRSAAASLQAVQQYKEGLKRAKVLPPAYSPHNFGFAFDLDVHQTLLSLKSNYATLTDILHKYNWYCHRRDMDPIADESWHFNYLGPRAEKYLRLAAIETHSTWSSPVEAIIQDTYGNQFHLTPAEVQESLAALKFYLGVIDGRLGPVSQAAIRTFQLTWGLPATGLADGRVQRVLAFLTAKINIITPNV